MTFKKLACILFILIIIILISIVSIKEQYTNKQIKEHFEDHTEDENDIDSEVEDDLNNKSVKESLDDRNNKMANDIANAVRNETIKGEETVLNKQISQDINVKKAAAVTPLNKPEELVKDSKSLDEMFKKLRDSEQLCTELQFRKDKLDQIEENKILRKSQIQLNEQQSRINELKNVVNQLRKEQLRNETINKKCQANNQKIINTDYDAVKNLAASGLLKDQSYKVELNVSDALKKHAKSNNHLKKIKRQNQEPIDKTLLDNFNLYNVTGNNKTAISQEEINNNYKKCNVDKNKYIDLNELQNGICHGCNPNKLKLKSDKINTDFK